MPQCGIWDSHGDRGNEEKKQIRIYYFSLKFIFIFKVRRNDFSFIRFSKNRIGTNMRLGIGWYGIVKVRLEGRQQRRVE